VLVRFYAPGDAESVEQCIIELQDAERKLEPDRVEGRTIAQRHRLDLLRICGEKTGQLYVAEDAGVVVGMVCIWLEREPETYLSTLTEYAYISDVVVLPAWRNRGVGRALLLQAERFAVEHGADVLRINVLARNVTAAGLYRAAGFREYAVSLLKHLEPANRR
jgi:ribosomal protein S18 acetylase RimI-like enzyme